MELKLILQRSQIFSSATEKFLWRWSDKKTEWCKYSANDSMLAESIIMEQIEMEWVLEHQLRNVTLNKSVCSPAWTWLVLMGFFLIAVPIWSIQFYLVVDIGKAGTSPFLHLFLSIKSKAQVKIDLAVFSYLFWIDLKVQLCFSLCKSYPRLRWGLQW